MRSCSRWAAMGAVSRGELGRRIARSALAETGNFKNSIHLARAWTTSLPAPHTSPLREARCPAGTPGARRFSALCYCLLHNGTHASRALMNCATTLSPSSVPERLRDDRANPVQSGLLLIRSPPRVVFASSGSIDSRAGRRGVAKRSFPPKGSR